MNQLTNCCGLEFAIEYESSSDVILGISSTGRLKSRLVCRDVTEL